MNAPQSMTDYLPSSVEAEQALLGAVLMQPDTLLSVSEIVRADMFSEALHSATWRVLEERITAGHTVTPLTLIATLGKDAEALIDGRMTVAQYIARIASAAISTVSAPEYAKIIRD